MFSGPFFDLEVGVMGPQANQSTVSGYLSTNLFIPLIPLNDLGDRHGVPLIVGYSRLFETGHATGLWLALAMPRFGKHKYDSDSLRIEVRDYWTFANPAQHNVMLPNRLDERGDRLI